jgi:DNA invertase Pin-like site-specific DNA recombinase
MSYKKKIDNIINNILNESDSEYDLDEYNEDTVNDLVDIINNNTINDPQPTLEQSDCYEVDELLDVQNNNNKTEYLVKWVGDWENTWEPENNINYNLIRDFQINQQINQHNQNLESNLGSAHIYLRVSDKTKTNNLFNRTQSSETKNNTYHKHQINVNELPQNVSSYQSYFTAFPEGNFSIDSQKTIIMKYCLEKKLLISSIKIDDGLSGRYQDKLIGLQEIISTIKKDEYLLFLDMSRFGRNAGSGIQILDDLYKKGVKIYSVLDDMNYDTPSAQHCVRSTLSCAQLESDLKSAKIKASIQNIKDKGGYIGSTPPYGFKIVQKGYLKKLVENSYEQKILKIIGHSIYNFSNNKNKYAIIATQLNSQHIKIRGKDFTSSKIKYLVKNRIPDEYFIKVDDCNTNIETNSDLDIDIQDIDITSDKNKSTIRKRKKTITETVKKTIKNKNKLKSININTDNTDNTDNRPRTRKRMKFLSLELKNDNDNKTDNKNDSNPISKTIKKRKIVNDID